MVKLTGGGIQSNKTVQSKSGGKVEPKPHAVSPGAADMMGQAVQFRKPPLVQGPGYVTKAEGPTGIANARKGPAGAAPGGMGRTIYGSGSQSATPPAREMPKGRDILSEFGPDIPGRRR
jgi:hypothetical protein